MHSRQQMGLILSEIRAQTLKPLLAEQGSDSQRMGKVGSSSVSRQTAQDKQLRFKALIRFQSHEEACRAVRERQGGYLLNLPVTLRVLP